VAAVSGEPYGSYISRYIFDPLEMRHSFISAGEARRNGMAEGHVPWFGFMRRSSLKHDPAGLPNGFLISTAEDLTHFAKAQLNGGVYQGNRVLSEGGIAGMQRAGVQIQGSKSEYALGWFLRTHHNEQVLWHGGALPGYHAALLLIPRLKLGVVVLTNASSILIGHPARALGFAVASILLGKRPSKPKGQPLWSRYLVADLIVVALLARQVRVLASTHAQPRLPRHRRIRAIGSSLLTAAFVLLGPPRLARAPLRAIALSMPDAAVTLGLFTSLAVLAAGLHGYRLARETVSAGQPASWGRR
jgi:CubicO group peptidase (beta-lactamase class C family)